MEQYILLCLDCHEIFPGKENHSCKRNVKKHLTERVERVSGQDTRLDGSTISKSSIYENGTYSQSAVSSTKEETTPDRTRKTIKPTFQTSIQQNTPFSFISGCPSFQRHSGDHLNSSTVSEPELRQLNLGVRPILQDDEYIHCTTREASNIQSVSDDHLMDNCSSPGNMGASVGPSKRRLLIHPCEPLDAEVYSRPENRHFECPICGKIIREKGNFNVHLRTHTGEKPYPCNMCEKKFKTQTQLDVHLRTHTGDKPYPCDTCEKKFSQKHCLDVHRRTHTGEKPYKCSICGKYFSDPSSLHKHYKNIHEGK